MKCETIRNMMSSYIDKDLNDIDKIELEKHLTECKQCKEEYESLLDIVTVCANLEEIELPQNFRTELHQRLTEEKKRSLFGNILGRKGMQVATGLVAAVLVIVIGIGSLPSLFNISNSKMAQSADSARGYGGTEKFKAEPGAPDVNYSMDIPAAEEAPMEGAASQPQITSANDSAGTRNFIEMELDESFQTAKKMPDQAVESSRSGRMVIRAGNISVNVESVDKAASDIRQLTEGSGGYVENSQIDNVTVPQPYDGNRDSAAEEATEKYANMTVRVPEAKFEDTFNTIKGMGKLVSENINGSDITSEYRDTEARVNNMKIQEQSLQQLMTKAENVDEILKIESELNRVRTDIDINSGNLKRWDNLVQLSTINIYMRELKPEELKNVDVPGMWEKAYQGFIKAINNVVAGLEKIFILLVAAIPYLIVVGVLAIIGIVAVRKVKKKKL